MALWLSRKHVTAQFEISYNFSQSFWAKAHLLFPSSFDFFYNNVSTLHRMDAQTPFSFFNNTLGVAVTMSLRCGSA